MSLKKQLKKMNDRLLNLEKINQQKQESHKQKMQIEKIKMYQKYEQKNRSQQEFTSSAKSICKQFKLYLSQTFNVIIKTFLFNILPFPQLIIKILIKLYFKNQSKNNLKFKLLDNSFTCQIQNSFGDTFQTQIKKNDIQDQLMPFYPNLADLYKQTVNFFRKQPNYSSGNNISLDQNYNLVYQTQFQRTGKKFKNKKIFKSKKVKQGGRSQKISNQQVKIAQKQPIKQFKQFISNKNYLSLQLNELKSIEQKNRKQLFNLKNMFSTENTNKIKKPPSMGIKYFDDTLLNFFTRFKLLNNNTITYLKCEGRFYPIMSPIEISDKFTTYSYKVIKTELNVILFGVASQQLRKDQINQHNNDDFIDYSGYGDGYVYDQKGKRVAVHKIGIRAGDVVTIQVNIKQLTVTWFRNKVKLYTTQISKRLAQKKLYPTLMMFDQGDTVQMSY